MSILSSVATRVNFAELGDDGRGCRRESFTSGTQVLMFTYFSIDIRKKATASAGRLHRRLEHILLHCSLLVLAFFCMRKRALLYYFLFHAPSFLPRVTDRWHYVFRCRWFIKILPMMMRGFPRFLFDGDSPVEFASLPKVGTNFARGVFRRAGRMAEDSSPTPSQVTNDRRDGAATVDAAYF